MIKMGNRKLGLLALLLAVVLAFTVLPELPRLTQATDEAESIATNSGDVDSLCVRRGNAYYFSYTIHAGDADMVVYYGKSDDDVLIGDWDGDGIDTICVRRDNAYYFKNDFSGGNADTVVYYGRTDDEVLVGDWDGDGKDTLAVRRGNTYYICNAIKSGDADQTVYYGKATDTVLVGDWDGDGKDTLTIRRGNAYYISNTIKSGSADQIIYYGRTDDEVLVGDWDGDNVDTLAARRGNTYYISNTVKSGDADQVVDYGKASDEVYVGCWQTSASISHDYEVAKTVDATCTTSGSVTYICKDCGDTYTSTTAALGHDYEVTKTVDATCASPGSVTYTCTRCGDSYVEATAATGAHDYKVTASQDATCTEDGYTTYTCTSCGDTYTDIVAATGHTESDEWVVTTEATDTSYGKKSILCTVCGAVLESENYALIEDNSQGINVEYHTQAEIKSYLEENLVVSDAVTVTFETEPSLTAPYALGEVSDESLETALSLVNAIRYVAGIDHSLILNDTSNEKAQGAALISYLNKSISHSPSQPSDMDDDLYALCYSGANTSNLSAGRSSLTSAILDGWMSDSSSTTNLSTVGHRRWILKPNGVSTGFGYVSGTTGYKYYAAMKTPSGTTTDSEYYGVAWPAQNMPIEYFHNTDPWSITMGYYSSSEGNVYINISDIEVTLTRISDGKTWNFTEDSSDGDFYIDNSGYGQRGCIIFRPSDINIESGDQFVVTITGIPEEISDETVSYQVNFFSVED